jgi:hypothetical protein
LLIGFNRAAGDYQLQSSDTFQCIRGYELYLFMSRRTELHSNIPFASVLYIYVNRDISVGIATSYEPDDPGIESRCGRDFPHLSRPALGPTKPPVQWVPGHSRGKERPGRDADPSPPSSAVVMKEYSYTSTPSMGRTTCTEPQCLYSRAIPLLPLWAVRPVQNLSACTRVHFTFILYIFCGQTVKIAYV